MDPDGKKNETRISIDLGEELYLNQANNFQDQQSMKVLTTQKFMNQIDLRCDDHVNKYKEDIQATRYCSECRSLCCDSCVIEFHSQHILSAKTKIDDYFRNQRLNLEDLRTKINKSIKFKININEINNTVERQNKFIESFFSKRRKQLEEMKSKLNAIIDQEKEIEKYMKETIQIFYKEECYKRLDKPIRENEALLMRIQRFLKDWESFSKTDKVRSLKNDQVSLFTQENDEILEEIKKNTDAFKGKSITIEKKIEEILQSLAFPEKITDFDGMVIDIINSGLQSKKQISKLKYDDLIEEKVDRIKPIAKNIPPFGINQGIIMGNISNMQPSVDSMVNNSNLQSNNEFNLIGNDTGVLGGKFDGGFTFNKKNNLGGFEENQIQSKGFPNIQQKNYQMMGQERAPIEEKYSKLPEQRSQINKSKLYEYELFISVKFKTEQLIVYCPYSGFTRLSINQNNFQNASDAFLVFPNNSKYINLGSSILLTGGTLNKVTTQNCYLILIAKCQNNHNLYEINIITYGKMIDTRERHNIIFLPDKNSVLVCSGFFKKSSEYTDINMGEWKSLPNLNEVRGNATMAYINNRFIYVIGGYQIIEKNEGAYLGNCEYLDYNNMQTGWKMINFSNNAIKLSAMGVIPINEQLFLLCGGFDGKQYRNEVYKVDVGDVNNPQVEKMENSLPGGFIFLHNNFIKIGETAYNIELGFSSIHFMYNNWSFNTEPYNG